MCHVAAVSISTTDSRILPRCMRIYNALARCPTHNMYLSHMPSLSLSLYRAHVRACVSVVVLFDRFVYSGAVYPQAESASQG